MVGSPSSVDGDTSRTFTGRAEGWAPRESGPLVGLRRGPVPIWHGRGRPDRQSGTGSTVTPGAPSSRTRARAALPVWFPAARPARGRPLASTAPGCTGLTGSLAPA